MKVLKEVISTYIEEDGKIKITETPLIRCGECIYWHDGRCWNMKGLNKTDGVVNADDFCSYGERRTDE